MAFLEDLRNNNYNLVYILNILGFNLGLLFLQPYFAITMTGCSSLVQVLDIVGVQNISIKYMLNLYYYILFCNYIIYTII